MIIVKILIILNNYLSRYYLLILKYALCQKSHKRTKKNSMFLLRYGFPKFLITKTRFALNSLGTGCPICTRMDHDMSEAFLVPRRTFRVAIRPFRPRRHHAIDSHFIEIVRHPHFLTRNVAFLLLHQFPGTIIAHLFANKHENRPITGFLDEIA